MPKRPSIADLSTKHQGEAMAQLHPVRHPDAHFCDSPTAKTSCVTIFSPDAPPAQSKPPRTHANDSGGVPVAFTGLPPPTPEYRFHPTRKWRFDWAWPDKRIALEIDGGLFVNGGHNRGAQRQKDYEKDANAMMLGWRVVRCSPGQLKSGEAVRWLKAIAGLDMKP